MTSKWIEKVIVDEDFPSQVEQVLHDWQGVQGAQVPPQGDHVLNVGGGNEVPKLNNRVIKEALLAFARAVTTQASLNIVPRVNAMQSPM